MNSAGNLSGSAERSRRFYRALGATGLAIRTTPEWDAQILNAVLEYLPASGRLLDVGCGYGRIAIPLAERGYEVTGLDVSSALLRAARREARKRGLRLTFDKASMTSMPYQSATFDAVLSLWTAFYELTDEVEQVAALGEMHRVLGPGGIGLIEGPVYEPPTEAEIASGLRRGTGHRVVVGTVSGLRSEHFAHDRETFARLARSSGLDRYEVIVRPWAGRERQLFVFYR